MLRYPVAIVVFALVSASATAGTGGAPQDIRAVVAQATSPARIDSIAPLLSSDFIFLLPGERPTVGREASLQLMRAMYERFEVTTTYDVATVHTDTDTLAEHGTVTLEFAARGGGERQALTVPCAWEYVRTEDAWSVSRLLMGSTGPVQELVPALPDPTGPYRVGYAAFVREDAGREDPLQPGVRRLVGFVVWYPAEPEPGAVTRRYASPAATRAAADFLQIPRAWNSHMSLVETNSFPHAPAADGRFPVILYNHGYSGSAGVHQTLCEELASHGYVVASVAHAHESAYFVYPDGRCEMFDPRALPYAARLAEASGPEQEAAKDRIMRARDGAARRRAYQELLRLSPLHQESTRIWADDCKFVLDELARVDAGTGPFAGRLDTDRAGAVGHSLGGAVAGQLTLAEDRVRAGVNLDGFQFGDLLNGRLSRPFLFMGAQRSAVGDSTTSNDIFHLGAEGPCYQVVVPGFEHASFTDLVHDGRAPGLGDGPLAGAHAVQAQRDLVRAFFDRHLREGRASETLVEMGARHGVIVHARP